MNCQDALIGSGRFWGYLDRIKLTLKRKYTYREST